MKTLHQPSSRVPQDGELHFHWRRKPLVLNVYQNLELIKQEKYGTTCSSRHDETNGHASYGGGRLLDCQHSGHHALTLDFTLAYNPTAYGGAYSCPVRRRKSFLLGVEVR
jgi:uncharacterized protein (DUF1684 family)